MASRKTHVHMSSFADEKARVVTYWSTAPFEGNIWYLRNSAGAALRKYLRPFYVHSNHRYRVRTRNTNVTSFWHKVQIMVIPGPCSLVSAICKLSSRTNWRWFDITHVTRMVALCKETVTLLWSKLSTQHWSTAFSSLRSVLISTSIFIASNGDAA